MDADVKYLANAIGVFEETPAQGRDRRIQDVLATKYQLIQRCGLVPSAALLAVEQRFIEGELEPLAFVDAWTTEREIIRRKTTIAYVRKSQEIEGLEATEAVKILEQSYMQMELSEQEFAQQMLLAGRFGK